MKILFALWIAFVATVATVRSEDRWKTVDEGFRMTIPWSWQKQTVQPIDSNCGRYKGETADLEFDELFGLGRTVEESTSLIAKLKEMEVNPVLLGSGEEVVHVDGRIGHLKIGSADPKIYGKRRFSKVAHLFVPYEGISAYLEIYILYASDDDLPTVRRVLTSIEWKKEASRSPEPTH